MDFTDLLASGVESTGDPRAKNPTSSASGAYQFLDKTWQAMGGTGSARDASPAEQKMRADALAAQNATILQRLGIPVNTQTKYLAWQQGPGGADALLKYPNDRAIDALIKGGVSPHAAEQHVLLNGGTRDMTAAEFAQHVEGMTARGRGGMATQQAGADALDPSNPLIQQILASSKPDATELGLFGDYQKANNAASAGIAGRAPAYADILAQEKALQSPTPPGHDDLHAPSEQQFRDAELRKVSDRPNDPTRVLSQFLPVLAMLGGALSKNGATSALKAAAAAMGAAKQNDKDAVDKAHVDFTSAMEDLKTQWEMRQQSYQDALEKFGNDRAGLTAQLSVLAAQNQDALGQEALKGGLLDKYHQMRQTESNAADKVFALLQQSQYHRDLIDLKRQEDNPSAGGLDDKGIDYAAEKYRKTGTLPPLGMGKAAAALRQRIIERAEQLATGAGPETSGASAADSDTGMAAGTKADTSSLTNITKIADASEAFEKTAMANFGTALKLAPKGIKTNMGPLIEKWVQDPERATGDPNIPAYQAALLTAANEYAKVIAGSTGSQGSTVDSRKEAAEMFSSFLSTDQIENVITVAQQDMANKIKNYAQQRDDIRGRISHSPGDEGAVPGGAGKPAPGGHIDKAAYAHDAEQALGAVRKGTYTAAQAKAALQSEYPNVPASVIDALFHGQGL